jgi:hypothetical protein
MTYAVAYTIKVFLLIRVLKRVRLFAVSTLEILFVFFEKNFVMVLIPA